MAIHYKIEYIATFYSDVASMTAYLEEYPSKARRIFEKLDHILQSLIALPKMFPVYDAASQFRRIVIEDYLVFYKLTEAERLIEVHRILCARMDIAKQLGK